MIHYIFIVISCTLEKKRPTNQLKYELENTFNSCKWSHIKAKTVVIVRKLDKQTHQMI